MWWPRAAVGAAPSGFQCRRSGREPPGSLDHEGPVGAAVGAGGPPAQHQSAQAARPFSGVTHARRLLYLYCPWAADSTAPVLVVPASWPPEPEGPSGAGDAEAEGAAPEGPGACGADAQGPDAAGSEARACGDALADAGADAEGEADAGADAEAEADSEEGAEEEGTYAPPASSTDGMLWPTPFPEPPSRAPAGAACPPSSRVPSVGVTGPTAFTAFDPSRAPVRSQPNAPSSAISAASATSPIATGLFLLLGSLAGSSGCTPRAALAGTCRASG
jgi:hypothetical protein